MAKEIKMSERDAKREHKRLILVLEKGTKEQRMKEAKRQREEMNERGIKV